MRVRARRELLTLRSPIARPASPSLRGGVSKRHGVVEGESELVADFTSLWLPRKRLEVNQ